MTTHTRHLLVDDTGTSTIEYALMTVVAAVLAGILYTIMSGETVFAALEALVQRALNTNA
jgi:Flp pilus assembly pilin Flp